MFTTRRHKQHPPIATMKCNRVKASFYMIVPYCTQRNVNQINMAMDVLKLSSSCRILAAFDQLPWLMGSKYYKICNATTATCT